MQRTAAIRVEVAEHGSRLEAGVAFIAPWGTHTRVDARAARVELSTRSAREHAFVPAADALFESMVRLGPTASGIVLTGLGQDGAHGLLALAGTGATTIAQDPSTCVASSMPSTAIGLGAAGRVMTPEQITRWLSAAAMCSVQGGD